jgi:integrase
MASFTKTAKGWRVQVARRGVRTSRTFITKKAAELWAAEQERQILDGEVSRWPQKTVADALDRYMTDITPSKGSAKAETLRLLAFERHFPDLSKKIISEVKPADIAQWRDAMLTRVSPGSVKRIANSLRAVWTVARKEWGWVGESPWSSVKMPAENPPRDRLAGWREIRRVLRRCDYRTGHPPVSVMQNVAWAFLVALRTGMRAAEILRLQAQDVSGSVVTVREHKTQHLTGKPRYVPVTPQGARLLGQLVGYAKARRRSELFTISSASLDALFRRATRSVLVDGLHFHDARATALTHLSRKVNVLDLAKISGHRDLKILSNVYYRDSPEQIAQRLALPKSRLQQRPIDGRDG